ncbi:MAG: hypothetical protein ACJAY9_000757 [Flavobacteriales bacterium]|jgi:hypothetical protein
MNKDKIIIERLKRKCLKLREKSLAANETIRDLLSDIYTQKYLHKRDKKMMDILQAKNVRLRCFLISVGESFKEDYND